MPHGLDDFLWDEVLAAMVAELKEVAAAGKTVQYGELSGRLHRRVPDVRIDPHYGPMPYLLAAVNVAVAEEDPDAPMLSALVVGADTNEPGNGFYNAAADLGHVVGDRLTFWLSQVRACHAWAREGR